MESDIYDPHNSKIRYKKITDNDTYFKGVSKKNTQILKTFLKDMEIGRCVNPKSKKGERSTGRLIDLASKLKNQFILLQRYTGKNDITKTTADELLEFFHDLRKGKILSVVKKKPYTAVGVQVKRFKTFWNWHIQKQRRQSKEIQDITIDLSAKDDKPKWNLITEKQLQKLYTACTYFYKVLVMFIFYSGIRSPRELQNVRKEDFTWHDDKKYYTLRIREESSKTNGRTIHLRKCSKILKEYLDGIKDDNEHIFASKSYHKINEYLRRKGHELFNIGVKGKSEKGYVWIQNGLTLYDFRHSSCCFWEGKITVPQMMKRFGWRDPKRAFYYSELKGTDQDVKEDDIYTDVTKTQLESEIETLKRQLEDAQQERAERDAFMKKVFPEYPIAAVAWKAKPKV